MNACSSVRVKFSEYLDGRLTGEEMQRIAAPLDDCRDCACEWFALRYAQASLAALGNVPESKDLLARIRVAVSQERARLSKSIFHGWSIAWKNTIGPFLLHAGVGLASAILLLGAVVVLEGLASQPQGGNERLGSATAPRLLYSLDGGGNNRFASMPNPVVVEACVNRDGRVYDFRIVSGPSDPVIHSLVENLLLESVFASARLSAQPVSGVAIVSFSGVSVRG
jgi:hypothetical protein